MSVKPVASLEDRKRAAEEERARIRAEGVELGVKIGERHKAWAYALGGAIVGAFMMGIYTTVVVERGMFNAGAVADRIVSRTVDPTLPARTSGDAAADYQSNAAAAREEACRRGVRDPRTGRCPGEPGTIPEQRR